MTKTRNNKKGGFTLIELLVAIAIIGLLSTVVLVSVSNVRKKGRDAKRMSDLREIGKALAFYYDDNNDCYPLSTGFVHSNQPGWSTTLQTSLSKYLPKLPKDPVNVGTLPWTNDNAMHYSYAYYAPIVAPATCPKKYDLIARLEDPTNPYRTEKQCYRYHNSPINPAERYWRAAGCPAGGGAYGYSPYMYADH